MREVSETRGSRGQLFALTSAANLKTFSDGEVIDGLCIAYTAA